MNHGDIAPTLHVRRNEVDRSGVVLAQKLQGAGRKNHAKAPSRVGWVLLEQLDLIARMPAFPQRGEIEPARSTTNHGNAHWPMLHGGPSGRTTSKISASFAPYSKLRLHDPVGKGEEHAFAVNGLVHDGVPARHNKNVLWCPRERFVTDLSATAALGDAEDGRVGRAIWVRLEARWQQLDERRHGWHGMIACDRVGVAQFDTVAGIAIT